MNIIASLIGALMITISTPTATEKWNHPMPKAWYISLAQCETRNNTKHSTRSYVGAFGFYRRTWDLFSNVPNRKAPTLTFRQQARVLDKAFWYGHTRNGRKQWAVGPWGHGCFKMKPHAQKAVCEHKERRVKKWCR
jgi:hypothetical protein